MRHTPAMNLNHHSMNIEFDDFPEQDQNTDKDKDYGKDYDQRWLDVGWVVERHQLWMCLNATHSMSVTILRMWGWIQDAQRATSWAGLTNTLIMRGLWNLLKLLHSALQLHFIMCPFPNQIQFGLENNCVKFGGKLIPNRIQFGLEKCWTFKQTKIPNQFLFGLEIFFQLP